MKLNPFNISIALEAVLHNKMRSVLTALGIIFGVAAVIAMLAIGSGAKQEILEQIELIGVNNIVITPVFDDDKEPGVEEEKEGTKRKFSPGLTIQDAINIEKTLPSVAFISPEIIVEKSALREGKSGKVRVVGVNNNFFQLNNFQLEEGLEFSRQQLLQGEPVCIVGRGVAVKYFPNSEVIGSKIKCGDTWLRVVGILEGRNITAEAMENLQIRDYNQDVYVPIKTALLRFRNRAMVTSGMLQNQRIVMGGGRMMITTNGEEEDSDEKKNYHQLDRLVVQVENTEHLNGTKEVIEKILERRHLGVEDYSIFVPELLLRQQQRAKDIFNIVLGAIAGISLIVGGIGIMNIMLASVLERIKEIGLRLALGATKKDVIQQFLLEAVIISVSGGILGIILGVLLALTISTFFDIKTIIQFGSIALAFTVSATVGLVFGIMPARQAANQDPIKSLRYE